MSNEQEAQRAAIKNLAAIAFIAVCVYFGFTPLFDLVNKGVAGQVIGASFGAIFVIVLTMYLLNKQTEIEQESKRGEKVFEEKIEFYKSLLQTVKHILDDGALDAAEVNQLSFALVELQMVGGDATVKAFIPILEKCNDVFHGSEEDVVEMSDEDRVAVLKDLAEFSQKCRVDLGIDKIELDKQVFNRAITQISEGVTRKVGNKEYFEGLNAKLQQLKDQGYNEDGVESYRILMSFFQDKAKSSDYYRVNMAKTGSTFNDDRVAKKNQIYVTNPQKRSSGLGIFIGEGSGLVDELYDYVLGKLGKDHSDNIEIRTEERGRKIYDCWMRHGLADEMGVAAYHDLLRHIADRVYQACEARGS